MGGAEEGRGAGEPKEVREPCAGHPLLPAGPAVRMLVPSSRSAFNFQGEMSLPGDVGCCLRGFSGLLGTSGIGRVSLGQSAWLPLCLHHCRGKGG